MKKIVYHKLVRDRIPEIIEQDGNSCEYSVLTQQDYIALLDEKLNEELAEYQESKSMEELADLLEVVSAVAAARGSSIGEVEKIRIRKKEKRGGFENRILLESVTEQDV